MSNSKEKLFKLIKQMTPGDVLKFCAKQLNVNFTKFLVHNSLALAKIAVQKGWAKSKNIKNAIKNFQDKDKDDYTNINWDKVEIDEDAIKFYCLFDNELLKKLKDFCKNIQTNIKKDAKLNEASKKKTKKVISAIAGDTAGDAVDSVMDSGVLNDTIDNVVDKAKDALKVDDAIDKVNNVVDATIDKFKDVFGMDTAEEVKEVVNDDSIKDDFKEQMGLTSISPLGWLRIAAKTTSYVLNNGQDVVDWFGKKKIKKLEDTGIIAEIRVQIENDGDLKYADSEFSVRFKEDDFKWHATCIDDRKMKFNDQKLIDKVLTTDSAKQFLDRCLKRITNIANPDKDSDYAVLPLILSNFDKFGLKNNDKFFNKIKHIIENFDKIKSEFAYDKTINEDESQESSKKEEETLIKQLTSLISDTLNNTAADQAADVLDEVFVGNFKDAVIDVYNRKAGDDLKDPKKLDSIMNDLKKFDGYETAIKKQELDSRKDTETSIEIDEDNAKFSAMWYSANNDENLGKILSDLVKTVQENGQKLEKDINNLKSKLSEMKIELSDKQFAAFSPVLIKLLNDNSSTDEIKKTIEQLKKTVNESMRKKILIEYGSYKLLSESKFMITENMASRFMLESVYENQMIMEAIVENLICEGWFGDALKKVKNSNVTKFIKDKSAEFGKKLADVGSETLIGISKYSIGPILKLGGITIGAITSGLGAELILKAMDFIEKNGKKITNTFERFTTQYSNSKGVITRMNYKLKDSDNSYSMRFYKKDMVWRVLNTTDQLKHPSKKYVKQIIHSNIGKKYRERLKQIWNPLFSDAKGGQVDFVQLLKEAKNINISEKSLKLFSDFLDNYDEILSNCIESPKIDTRSQEY